MFLSSGPLITRSKHRNHDNGPIVMTTKLPSFLVPHKHPLTCHSGVFLVCLAGRSASSTVLCPVRNYTTQVQVSSTQPPRRQCRRVREIAGRFYIKQLRAVLLIIQRWRAVCEARSLAGEIESRSESVSRISPSSLSISLLG